MSALTPIFVDREDASDIYRYVDIVYPHYENIALLCQKSPKWVKQYPSVGFITDPKIERTTIDVYLQTDLHQAMGFLEKQYANPLFLLGNQRLLTDINPLLPHARLKGSTPVDSEEFAADSPSQLVEKLRTYTHQLQ